MNKYQIIYADPPWRYKDKSKSHGGGAESHYPTMSVEDICQLKIPADGNSVLLLWATYPQLQEALKVIQAWDFVYKTVAFTWIKTTNGNNPIMGMGRYTRTNAEVCLLAIRGRGCNRLDASVRNTQFYPRTAHSRKPTAFRNEIIRLFGDLPRIELFARQKVEGWDCWGNEVESDIEL